MSLADESGGKIEMKFNIAFIVFTFIFGSQAFAVDPVGSLDDIPNGYRDGRADAPYGSYFPTVQKSAREFQNQILYLERKVLGLSGDAAKKFDEIRMTEFSYLLEHELIAFMDQVSEAPHLKPFERESFIYSALRTYRSLRTVSERLYEDMIRFVDVQLPGPNGLHLRVENPGKPVLYHPNYRSDRELSEKEQKEAYQKRLKEFEDGGGRLNEIKVLNSETISRWDGLIQVEYVVLEDGTIRITEGKAGHILLAEGNPVQSAGQFIFHRRDGGIVFAVVTNASGSYKPDILSAELLANRLTEVFKIPNRRIIVTKGEPYSTQTLKVYLKAKGEPKVEIDRHVQALKSWVVNNHQELLRRQCGDSLRPLLGR
jgi:hypothetical protein